MQSAHLSFQEYYAARALYKGISLYGEPPWRWSAWWNNTLRLGSELGDGFGVGLVRAARVSARLDLSSQIGGHRPTSVAAVAELMRGVESIDLSDNRLSPTEVLLIANSVRVSTTLTELTLAKNVIDDEAAAALADALKTSRLVSLSLFSCSLKENGVKALVNAVPAAPNLSRLNVQFNAIRGEYKQALERANAQRDVPLSLAL